MACLQPLHQGQHLTQTTLARQQSRLYVILQWDHLDNLGHRHAKQGIKQGKTAYHEGALLLRRVPPTRDGEALHQTSAHRGKLQQWAGKIVVTLVIGIKQQLYPALQLAAPQYHDGLAERGNFGAEPHRNRVDQTEQVEGKLGLSLEHLFDLCAVGVLGHQCQQAHQYNTFHILRATRSGWRMRDEFTGKPLHTLRFGRVELTLVVDARSKLPAMKDGMKAPFLHLPQDIFVVIAADKPGFFRQQSIQTGGRQAVAGVEKYPQTANFLV